MTPVTIIIARDFCPRPAGRFIGQGPFTGEQFRRDFLEKNLDADQVIIDFEGTRGCGPSFLEEAFGGLVRLGKIKKEDLLKKLVFRGATKASVIDETKSYIMAAVEPPQ